MSRRTFPGGRVLPLSMAIGCAVLGSAPSGQQLPGGLPIEAIRQIESVLAEKEARTPAEHKIASALLHASRVRRGVVMANAFRPRAGVDIDASGRVLVDVRTRNVPGIAAQIARMGGVVASALPKYEAVRAQMTLDAVELLAQLPDVMFVAPADHAITHQQRRARPPAGDGPVGNKLNTSEGDVAHRAAEARSTFGITGAGIGIGVLSDGVNSLAARQASGDLPAVTVLAGQAGSGDEGTAMLEIVHDLAPGASLFFATAFSGQASFASNIEALCTAGANVIVDDVFYFSETVFQDGIIAQGVNYATDAGCYHFSSSGNSGNLNDGTSGVWEGDFLAAASNPGGIGGGNAHEFEGGNNSNRISLDTANGFALKWSDPRGASSNDYDLFLFNSTLTVIEAFSTNSQTGSQDPYEFISSAGFNDLNNRLVVVKRAGAANRFLHLNTIRGRLAIATSGQTGGHGAAENALGVAAVNVSTAGGGAFTGGLSNPVATYSSDGPRRIFFKPDGTAITPGNFSSTGGQVLQKPDLAAADCVSTSTPGFGTFCGTSAAAPHAAAIAALVLQRAGGPRSLTLAQLRQRLQASALDIETAGTDRDSGAGIVMAMSAIHQFTDHPIVPGETLVRAVHINELRTRVNEVRSKCGLGSFSFSDATLSPGATVIRAVHIIELRSALNAAYSACGRSAPPYTDETLSPLAVSIRAAHVSELRSAVLALE